MDSSSSSHHQKRDHMFLEHSAQDGFIQPVAGLV